jgi:two-component system nitrate/nitrite response regulator NarL
MPTVSDNPIRILLIDDHPIMRDGLRMLLESQPGMKVVGMAGKDALELARSQSPDLILLDLDLGGENGLTLLPELRAAAKDARILILTGLKDSEAHRQAIRLGAMGVVLKEDAAEVLIKAIKKVHAGEVWVDRSTMGSLLHEMTRKDSDEPDLEAAKIATLTDRERQVITLIAEGLKNKQIAERSFLSETTITHYLSSIFNKLEVSDRLELVIYAFRHNLARMPR